MSPTVSGNRVTAPDGVDLVGGVEEHLLHLAQGFAGGGVPGSEADELLVEENALGKVTLGPADGQGFALAGQGGVHVVHPRELQQQTALVDPAGGGGDRRAVQIVGGEGGEIGGVDALGEDLHLSLDAVGAYNPARGDEFLFHGGTPSCKAVSSVLWRGKKSKREPAAQLRKTARRKWRAVL